MCNNCVYNICDPVNVCDGVGTVKIPSTAASTGEYILHLKFLGIMFSITKSFTTADPLEFDAHLNGDYCYESYVLDPSGGKVSETIDGIVYENFKFCTKQISIHANIINP